MLWCLFCLSVVRFVFARFGSGLQSLADGTRASTVTMATDANRPIHQEILLQRDRALKVVIVTLLSVCVFVCLATFRRSA